MRTMTIDELFTILTECAGASDGADAATAAVLADTSFDDLGYDSLAVIETASRVEQELGVTVPEDDLAEATTPRGLLDLVNRSLAEAS